MQFLLKYMPLANLPAPSGLLGRLGAPLGLLGAPFGARKGPPWCPLWGPLGPPLRPREAPFALGPLVSQILNFGRCKLTRLLIWNAQLLVPKFEIYMVAT